MLPETLYCLTRAVMGFGFQLAWVMGAIYLLRDVGLNPFQLVLVGTVLELSVFLGEIPTGVLADTKSRKLSVVIGCFLIGGGFYLQGAVPFFHAVLIAQVIWGIGFTFTSGAHEAWLADEVGPERLAGALLRGAQWHQAASFVGIFVSVVLADLRLDLPLRTAGVLFVALAVFLAFGMRETGFRPIPKEESEHTLWHLLATFREGLRVTRARTWLLVLMLIFFLGGLASEAYDRLWEAYLLDHFELPALGGLDAIYWFGLIHAIAMLGTVFALRQARGLEEEWDGEWEAQDHRAFGVFCALLSLMMIVGGIFFVVSREFLMAVMGWIILYIARQVLEPFVMNWVHLDLPSGSRATVVSTLNQTNAVGQVIGGPILGAAALRFGLRATFLLTIVLFLPIPDLYRWAARRRADVAEEA